MKHRNANFSRKLLKRGRREVVFYAKLGYWGETVDQQVTRALQDNNRVSYRPVGYSQQWGLKSDWNKSNSRRKSTQVETWTPTLNDKGLRPGAGEVIK